MAAEGILIPKATVVEFCARSRFQNRTSLLSSKSTHRQGNLMAKHRNRVALAVLIFALAGNLYASRCTDESLKGKYAYSSQGFVEVTTDVSPSGFVPWAQIGTASFDGNGSISSGTFSAVSTSKGSGVNNGTFSGAYSVSGDCTGNAIVTTDAGEIFHFDLVIKGPRAAAFISNQSNEFLSVFSFQKVTDEVQNRNASKY
jgi:hypothetical protein